MEVNRISFNISLFTTILWLLLSILTFKTCQLTDEHVNLKPTVVVAFFIRNKAHTLPYFLHYLDQLDYPKDRIAIWVRADHNVDPSVGIIQKWIENSEHRYHWVDFWAEENGYGFAEEKGPCDWTDDRFRHMIKLRQDALDAARRVWADYILFTDVDNFLKNDQVLNNLIQQQKTIVSPMLNATASEHYSNFWGAMDESGYYKRSDDYKSIQLRHVQGCFPVALVHSTVLIDLHRKESQSLNYYPLPDNYKGPLDDIIIFAHSAMAHAVPMYILNEDFYGFMQVPMEAESTLEDEKRQLLHLKLESIIYHQPMGKLPYITESPKKMDTMGFDQIYVVNLERRPDRREKMQLCLKELGIQYQLVSAVDGRQLNDSYLEKIGIKMLPHFSDPYKGRAMTMGEVGCFLSHYNIWRDVAEKDLQSVLIFEDDIRFELDFRENLQTVKHELKELNISWDLVYLGRKRLYHSKERWVDKSKMLVWPHYSYWTLSYMLSRQGAEKLLSQEPLSSLVPVDEYLPIMFDRHPEDVWKNSFSPRNLVALSAQPLLVYPTHYTGEPGYFTDTEDSEVIPDKLKAASEGVLSDLGQQLDLHLKGDIDELTGRDEL